MTRRDTGGPGTTAWGPLGEQLHLGLTAMQDGFLRIDDTGLWFAYRSRTSWRPYAGDLANLL